ncbi:acetate kinase [Salinibacterium sp.]|uniref:acetate/propionate family kinase n=1 Tax=Salinibacterium sp. TaxID=1915057 RepID=UPI00286AA3DE|nr:acetate kinase [Salinibacterium sp.]
MTTAFIVNSGSSSIKWELVDVESERRVRGGIVERIGEPGAAADHAEAMRGILGELGGEHPSVIGHRVVHGGSRFTTATLVTDEVEAAIEALSALAPLHNPPNLAGIRAARVAFPGVANVAVFDTAFHQSLPPAAYTYAIDSAVAHEHSIRRYGFHGTSYQYVARRAAALLSRPLEQLKLIVFHLGNGASVAAIDGGRSVETSMGMTPLEGLVMGTRSGDLDAGILFHLGRAGHTLPELDAMLNRRSGLLGVGGSGDLRDIQAAAGSGDAAAALALDVYHHRLRHYLGAYLVQLGGADAIVFTAGVGENSAPTRAAAVSGLGWLGMELDDARNDVRSRDARVISTDASPVAILVVPTNEELEIARQAIALVR